MPPSRIMIIRHAEKPEGIEQGIAPDGQADQESLSAKGWQRANALPQLFLAAADLTPDVVFASEVEHHSESRRPIETVSPLVGALALRGTPARFVTTHPKDDLRPLIDDVLSRDGQVLVCWEHTRIPVLCGLIPSAPAVPQNWPGDRFDIVWIFDRAGPGWSFSQKPQLLLEGDRPDPIT